MAFYVVSYDLISPGQNYKALEDAIEKASDTALKILESVWRVSYNGSADDLLRALSTAMDRNDAIYVVEMVTSNDAGRNTKSQAMSERDTGYGLGKVFR